MKFQPGRTPVQAIASLKEALTVMENAEHCAVLWFADINKRKLYKKLGFSSMSQFAKVELQFSRTRIGDYLQLANKLETLPVLRASLADGKLGPSKAREIIKVATPATERDWVEEAVNTTRPVLRDKVKRVRDHARNHRPGAQVPPIKGLLTDPHGLSTSGSASGAGATSGSGDQGLFGDQTPAEGHPQNRKMLSPAEVPVRISVEMMPDQFARYEALLEKLRKLGHATNAASRTALLLDGLESLIHELEDPSLAKTEGKSARRRALAKPKHKRLKGFAAPTQVHVHHCPECEQATVTTGRGEMPISEQTFQRLACDATLDHPELPNKATIPPSRRRAVLTRDRHRCQAPGCRHTHHLEIHHIVPRNRGGSNRIDNLITLCSGCHRIWHEIGGPPPGWVRAARGESETKSGKNRE